MSAAPHPAHTDEAKVSPYTLPDPVLKADWIFRGIGSGRGFLPLRFVTKAEVIKEEYKGRTNYWVTRPELTGAKDLQVCEATLPAGECHAFHTHPELDEMIYVLPGEVEQSVEKEKRILKPGVAAHIPAGIVHATLNVSKADATILASLSPGASEGPFMVDVSGEAPSNQLRGPA